MVEGDPVHHFVVFIGLELTLDGSELFQLLLFFCVGVANLYDRSVFPFTNLPIVERFYDLFADFWSFKTGNSQPLRLAWTVGSNPHRAKPTPRLTPHESFKILQDPAW